MDQRYIGIFWGGQNIINVNGREIQIWSNTIKWKDIVEGVINCHIVLFYHWNLLVLTLLWNDMTQYELLVYNPHTQYHYNHKSKISTLCHPTFIYPWVRLTHLVVILYFIIVTEISANNVMMKNIANRNIRILLYNYFSTSWPLHSNKPKDLLISVFLSNVNEWFTARNSWGTLHSSIRTHRPTNVYILWNLNQN